MNDRSDVFLNRKHLAQLLYSMSEGKLLLFRDQFPTPILDEQIESALKLAIKYSAIDKKPVPTASKAKRGEPVSILQPKKQWKAKKKMRVR